MYMYKRARTAPTHQVRWRLDRQGSRFAPQGWPVGYENQYGGGRGNLALF